MKNLLLSLFLSSLIIFFSCKNEQKPADTGNIGSETTTEENINREIKFYVNDRPVYKDQLNSYNMNVAKQDEIIYQTALINERDKDPALKHKVEFYKKLLVLRC